MSPTSAQQELLETTDAQTASPPTRPTRYEVIIAVREEALAKGIPCGKRKARSFVSMIARAVNLGRRNCEMYHLQESELDSLHPLLEALMPDEVRVPAEGSAHDLLHKHLLKGDEFALVHTKAGERLEYCAVAIVTESITTS